jgi:pimeloyl-ACP methyl ester carboxylesterase
MADCKRFILAAGIAAVLSGCSASPFETALPQAAAPATTASFSGADQNAPATSGHVYLLRGLIGDIFSRGMDKLADEMNRRGVPAQTHGVFAWASVADEAARTYRADAAPIILIGHSTGGDNAILMARRLQDVNVPVAMLITFDPTPIADPVPANVEHALNIYQSTNPIGGGHIRPGPGFHGHMSNVNLREHHEIIHITMDKSETLHDLVAAKILEVVHAAQATRAVPVVTPQQQQRLRLAATPPPRPAVAAEPAIPIKYTVPGNAPIALWDSGMAVTVADDDSLATIAQKYGAPAWAITQINNLNGADGIAPGQRLVIPRNAFVVAAVPPPESKSIASAKRKAPANKRDVRAGKPVKQLSQAAAGGT